MLRVVICACALALSVAAPTGTSSWKPMDYVNALPANASPMNYFVNPNDCTEYFLAFKQLGSWKIYNFTCPAGQKWDKNSFNCVPGSCAETTCALEGALLPDPDNCASFLHCSNGIAYQKCCPDTLAWNDTEKVCDYVPSCGVKASCPQPDLPAPTTTKGPEPEFCVIGHYIYAKVVNNTNLYKLTNNKTGTPVVESAGVACPFGYIFSVWECGCINPDKDQPVVDVRASCVALNFETSISTSTMWVGQTATGCDLKEGRICFSDQGYLNVPYYNNIAFKDKLQLSLNYTSTNEDAIFVSNGYTLKESSFCLYMEKNTVKARIETNKGIFIVEEQAAAGVISVKYDGTDLSLKVADVEASVKANGLILRKASDLIIGSTLVGCIDDFDFCPAIIQ